MASDDDGVGGVKSAAGWSVAAPLVHHAWGEELAVYDPRSGRTHLLEWAAAAVFGVLSNAARPLPAREVTLAVLAGEADAAEEDVASIEATLRALERLGLALRGAA